MMAPGSPPPRRRPLGSKRRADRRAQPSGAAAWLIVGVTMLLCFAVVPGMRDTSAVAYASRAVKRAAITSLDSHPGNGDGDDLSSSGSLLHIPYEALFNATPPALRPLCLAFFVLVLTFLFCSISITASDFFCPNLASMAAHLGLSETTAGVTLLAFGNGSPDVFSTFIAMREGTFGLAAGELIGAASFITSIVVGSIAMIKPFHVPRYAFVRDVSFFMGAVLLFMWALADGHLTLRESGAMVILYVLYVFVVITGNWWQQRQRRKEEYASLGWKSGTRDEEEATQPTDASADAALIPEPSPTLAPPPFTAGRFGRRNSSASLHAQFTATEAADPHHPLSQSAHFDTEGDTPRAGFSLLGAVEFRDVVNSLRQSGELPPSAGSSRNPSRASTPARSPVGEREPPEPDYFHPIHSHRIKHNRHSSVQGLAVVERRVSLTRSRSSSLHPAWTAKSRQSTLDEHHPALADVEDSPPHPDSDPDAELIAMASSPKKMSNLTLNIPPQQLPSVVATTSPAAIAHSPITPVPQISLHNEEGEAESPVMPSLTRSTTVEMARKGINTVRVVLHTLFPSLQGFRHKSLLGMGLAVLSVPAILVLTLTLPVIDDGRTDEGGVVLPGGEDEPLADATGDSDSDSDGPVDREISGELHHLVENGYPHFRRGSDVTASSCEDEDDCMAFNPALTAAQCVFGPVVCGYLVFQEESHLHWILIGALICGSVAACAVLKFAEDGTSRPWRLVRCCAGFVCSMVWIASIADEVVSVLSTFGEIFGLSDAIIGLTIFAIGNSLADLVANVTIAQFSPNMAYAACFGGPMLNLLLGVGAGGSYSILWSRSHEPVHLDFSPTLWVSGIGLLIVLATTAVTVPLNKFRIDRRWAMCLFIGYGTLMTTNVIVEIRSERRGNGNNSA